MDKYYYLAAQLPVLTFTTEPGITSADFLREAEKWLSARDLAALLSTSLDRTVVSETAPPALRPFILHEYQLRDELARWRRARLDSHEVKLRLVPAALLQEGNPLEIERELLLRRWDLIGELELGHYSDIEFMVFFYLKLQILERMQRFDRETGRDKFQSYTKTNS